MPGLPGDRRLESQADYLSVIYLYESPDTTMMTRPQTVASGRWLLSYWAQGMAMRYSISNIINNRNDFHDHELRQFAWSQVLTGHHSASTVLWYSVITWCLLTRHKTCLKRWCSVHQLKYLYRIYHQEHPSHLRSEHKQILTPYRKTPGECLKNSMRGTHGRHIPRWHLSPDADLWPHGN